MKDYDLVSGTYVMATPAGAYHAISHAGTEKSRRVIRHLLKEPRTPRADEAFLKRVEQSVEIDSVPEILFELQAIGYLDGSDRPLEAPDEAIEDLVKRTIAGMSSRKKALLTDDQGFYLAAAGFPHETAGELAALAAQLGEAYDRRRGVLRDNLGFDTSAMALVDSSGASEIGFWPLYVGRTRFTLVIEGAPKFNQSPFTELAWALTRRYDLEAIPGDATERPQV